MCSHLDSEIPRYDIVWSSRLDLAIGRDSVHRQRRQRRCGLSYEDDHHREKDARLTHDERKTDEQDHAKNILHARQVNPLDCSKLALGRLLPVATTDASQRKEKISLVDEK